VYCYIACIYRNISPFSFSSLPSVPPRHSRLLADASKLSNCVHHVYFGTVLILFISLFPHLYPKGPTYERSKIILINYRRCLYKADYLLHLLRLWVVFVCFWVCSCCSTVWSCVDGGRTVAMSSSRCCGCWWTLLDGIDTAE